MEPLIAALFFALFLRQGKAESGACPGGDWRWVSLSILPCFRFPLGPFRRWLCAWGG